MPAFHQNQILDTNIFGWPEIDGEHSYQQDLENTNPLFFTGDACYQNNCQRCVIAYEARRRGFDVHAKPYLYRVSDTLPYDDIINGWPSVFKNPVLEYCGASDASDVINNIHNFMLSWGEGSRAIVSVEYICGGGHVFIAEFRNRMVHFIDPQNVNLNCNEYFDVINTKKTAILRIDNRAFTNLVRECCEGTKRD